LPEIRKPPSVSTWGRGVIIWLRCGNTSNAALKELLIRELPDCMARLSDGAAIIELGRDPGSDPGVGADQ